MQPTLHCACFDHARETYGDRETRVEVVDINGEMLRDSQTYHNSAHAFFCFPRAGGVKPLQRHRSHSWKQTLKNCPLKRPLTTHMISTLSHMGSGTLPSIADVLREAHRGARLPASNSTKSQSLRSRNTCFPPLCSRSFLKEHNAGYMTSTRSR